MDHNEPHAKHMAYALPDDGAGVHVGLVGLVVDPMEPLSHPFPHSLSQVMTSHRGLTDYT